MGCDADSMLRRCDDGLQLHILLGYNLGLGCLGCRHALLSRRLCSSSGCSRCSLCLLPCHGSCGRRLTLGRRRRVGGLLTLNRRDPGRHSRLRLRGGAGHHAACLDEVCKNRIHVDAVACSGGLLHCLAPARDVPALHVWVHSTGAVHPAA